MKASLTADLEKTVVCGHRNASYGHAVLDGNGTEFEEDADFSPYYGKKVIAIDACTAYSGKVNCIVLEGGLVIENNDHTSLFIADGIRRKQQRIYTKR